MEQTNIPMVKVNSKTRSGFDGREIICPHCAYSCKVYHFCWSALICQGCKACVYKNEYLTRPPKSSRKKLN